MSKKPIEMPRKSPRLIEGTSTDELKDWKEKKNEAKKRATQANQKGKKRKGKIVETPSDYDFDFVSEIKKKKTKKTTNVEVAQFSKPSTRRTIKKKESEISTSKTHKKVVR
ncbi:hypothetical protein H5410_025515, partial [Solanum commersonii]